MRVKYDHRNAEETVAFAKDQQGGIIESFINGACKEQLLISEGQLKKLEPQDEEGKKQSMLMNDMKKLETSDPSQNDEGSRMTSRHGDRNAFNSKR